LTKLLWASVIYLFIWVGFYLIKHGPRINIHEGLFYFIKTWAREFNSQEPLFGEVWAKEFNS
jgi:hypothetical protein